MALSIPQQPQSSNLNRVSEPVLNGIQVTAYSDSETCAEPSSTPSTELSTIQDSVFSSVSYEDLNKSLKITKLAYNVLLAMLDNEKRKNSTLKATKESLRDAVNDANSRASSATESLGSELS